MDQSIDVKSLFKLSPLSIFDGTTEGLTAKEKEALIKKGEAKSWKIIDETKTKLEIKGSSDDAITLCYFKYKNNPGGLLGVETTNGQNSNIQFWKYLDEDKSFEKSNSIKKISANDFVSEEHKLPDSYQPQLSYKFIDDQTIEVTLYTWMQKEFEKREVTNRVFLKWNGTNFVKEISKEEQVKGDSKFNVLNKPTYDLSKLDVDGKIVNKRVWEDSNGENIVLFTRKKNELFVYHYTTKSNNAKLLRKVYDFEKECDYDLIIGFIENSIKVTDLGQ